MRNVGRGEGGGGQRERERKEEGKGLERERRKEGGMEGRRKEGKGKKKGGSRIIDAIIWHSQITQRHGCMPQGHAEKNGPREDSSDIPRAKGRKILKNEEKYKKMKKKRQDREREKW